MRPELIGLLKRMARNEGQIDSAASVSWHAYREAEKLTDPTLLPELQAFLAGKTSKDERSAAYFVLGCLGENANSLDCAVELINHIGNEQKNKYLLSNLLSALSKIKKPAHLDLTAVYELLNDPRWLVRHSAIQSLAGAESAQAEDELLRVLATSEDPYDQTYCHATLGEIGSARSLPALEKSLSSRKRDVKDSARFAIDRINARSAGPTPARQTGRASGVVGAAGGAGARVPHSRLHGTGVGGTSEPGVAEATDVRAADDAGGLGAV